MNDCVFCALLAGTLPVSVVFRDDVCMAFMDIQPINPGHLLVVPNRHAAFLSDLDAHTGAHMFRVAHRLAGALRQSGVRCEGVNLFIADGEAADQEIFHTHIHVFPRFHGDGFGLRFAPNYPTRPERQELDALARKIHDSL